MNDKEISLVDLFRVIKKRKTMILGLTAIITLGGAGWAIFRPAQFTAQGIIRMGRVAEKWVDSTYSVVSAFETPSRFSEAVEKTKLRYVPRGVSWRSERSIKKIVGLELVKKEDTLTDMVKISVTWRNPDDAAALVKALGEAVIAEHNQMFTTRLAIAEEQLREKKDEIDQLTLMIAGMESTQRRLEESAGVSIPEIILLQADLEARLRLLSQRRDEFNLLRLALSVEPLTFPTRFLEPPSPPVEPNPRRRLLITAAAFVFGLTISTVVAFAREYLELAR